MGIGLTEEHEALAASVRGFAERHGTAGAARALAARLLEDPGAAPGARPAGRAVEGDRPGFWDALAAQGLLGLHLGEEHGGQGYGLLEAAVALEALGLAPGPYLPTLLASAVIARSGASLDLLPGLADGSLTGAVALSGGLAAGDGRVTGRLDAVLGASGADVLVVPLDTGGWAVLDAAAVTVEPLPAIDLTRGLAAVSADGAPVRAALGAPPVRELAAVLFGAEACGIAAWGVDTAAAYARTREQFGRPIGQFQGVKHKCAAALVALEHARAAVWDAARALDAAAPPARPRDGAPAGPGDPAGDGALPPGTALAASVAGLLAPDAAVRCTADAHQVLGGIGYTFEHDAHLHYRRALALRALLGGEHAGDVIGRALEGDLRALELDLPAGAAARREEIRAEVAAIAALDPLTRVARLADGGWVMPHLPEPWGRGASPLDQVLIHQELRAAGVRPPFLAIGAWVVPSLVAHGSREQQERFLPKTFRGEILWCQLFSEPGAGSDLASLTTKAVRAEGGWRLTGQKVWNSLAREAQWAICLARTDPDAPKHDGITYFLVDMSSPGLDVRPLREITGEAIFNEVFLDDVFVPDDCVVGAVNGGWRVARDTLSSERVALGDSWGPGTRYTDMLDLLRKLGGARPARLEEAGRLYAEGQAIDALGLRVTLRQLAGTDPGTSASVRKLLGMRHSQAIAEFCWSLCGESGASTADGPAAYWARMILATRAFTIGGGTTEIQLNIIAERLLGLPRDP
ncbi:acyl-CoA dehydrogenase [Bailinhaonella thermotolerans]|uniref:Acyl-CoA dehydrogenase n=1 Tax=Bailinhaonella thermotolerans TaxID=1070861 RepID=A0A3A4B7J6_9ACTN|nr:acyl-CoA dehydrogenase [Bailinhaonella thermotolerans]RJL34201.1 acyl-CoA dehydrogenase [Bailinhaonella thermotolerans]